MKARMLDQPLGNVVMLMGAVIVQYQMQVQAAGDLSIKLAEKFQIFLMSMTRHTAPMTVPSKTLRAAKRIVVPCRLAERFAKFKLKLHPETTPTDSPC